MRSVGIAIAGKKGAGKDTLAEYIQATRPSVLIVRCKTPIVEAYERIVGHPYEKARDDAELIRISRDVIRAQNDEICADWLDETIPAVLRAGLLPVVPDMRRLPEFRVLKDSMLCIKVVCDEAERLQRIYEREGTVKNYDPSDATEVDVDLIDCPYTVDNSKRDNGKSAILALERLLAELDLFQEMRGIGDIHERVR